MYSQLSFSSFLFSIKKGSELRELSEKTKSYDAKRRESIASRIESLPPIETNL